MKISEQIILNNLNSFRNSGCQKHLTLALRTIEYSIRSIDFNLLEEEIRMQGLQKEWNIIRDIWFTQFINF